MILYSCRWSGQAGGGDVTGAIGVVRESGMVLTVQALLIFVILDLGVRLYGLPRVCRSLQRWSGRRHTITELKTPPPVVARTVKAVRRATRYYWRSRLDCLPRSMTIYLLLRGCSIPATLHIGVKRYPFGAHAWVECLGSVLDDSAHTQRHERYSPIIST